MSTDLNTHALIIALLWLKISIRVDNFILKQTM